MHRAFTLIELLVVISIIAVLAGMLLPAIGLVRRQAKQTSCASAQRQLAAACIAYANDNDGLMPSVKDNATNVHWYSHAATILGYDNTVESVKKSPVWGCPEWSKDHVSSQPGIGYVWYYDRPYTARLSSYTPASGLDTYAPCALAAIKDTGRRILLGDATDFHLWFNPSSPASDVSKWDLGRHTKRAVYAFFDGHVQVIAEGANAWQGNADPTAATWNP